MEQKPTDRADHGRPALERLHVGCAGWSIFKTVADRFPPEGSHLGRYAGRFTAVEINSSFYRWHRPATYQRWAESVPANFRFAVKMPREITHSLRLRDSEPVLDQFLSQCTHLGEKLGPLLVQLPPSLSFNAETSRQFWHQLRDKFGGEIVCEPRHSTWFCDQAERMLADFSIARAAADPAVVPQAGLPGAYQRLVYFRLHGKPRIYYSSYDHAFLENAAARLAAAYRAGANVWSIFDNTAEGAAVCNAIDLGSQLLIVLGTTKPG